VKVPRGKSVRNGSPLPRAIRGAIGLTAPAIAARSKRLIRAGR
jgi:hypothetical protein